MDKLYTRPPLIERTSRKKSRNGRPTSQRHRPDSYREIPFAPAARSAPSTRKSSHPVTCAVAPTPQGSLDRCTPRRWSDHRYFSPNNPFLSHHLPPPHFRLKPLPVLTLKAEG